MNPSVTVENEFVEVSPQLNADYNTLVNQAKALLSGEHDLIANLANISALLFNNMTNVNWLGFYLYKDNELVLGPFQGNVACVRIPLGKGVCGTAAVRQSVLRVDNVHDFDGHIACDAASNSEIVVPIIVKDMLIGVLDIDSPKLSRFGEQEEQFCKLIVKAIEANISST